MQLQAPLYLYHNHGRKPPKPLIPPFPLIMSRNYSIVAQIPRKSVIVEIEIAGQVIYIAGRTQQQAMNAWRSEREMNKRGEFLVPEHQPILVGGQGTDMPEILAYPDPRWSSCPYQREEQMLEMANTVSFLWPR